MNTQETVKDYQLAAQEMKALWDGLGFEANIYGGHVATDDDGWNHRAYVVMVKRRGYEDGASVSLPWRACLGHKAGAVNPWEVLGRALADGESAETSFGDWCAIFGYEEDSRKALETYLECQRLGREACKLVKATERRNFIDLTNRL
jgi:hypothetical protein